jgi:hypothetical protein
VFVPTQPRRVRAAGPLPRPARLHLARRARHRPWRPHRPSQRRRPGHPHGRTPARTRRRLMPHPRPFPHLRGRRRRRMSSLRLRNRRDRRTPVRYRPCRPRPRRVRQGRRHRRVRPTNCGESAPCRPCPPHRFPTLKSAGNRSLPPPRTGRHLRHRNCDASLRRRLYPSPLFHRCRHSLPSDRCLPPLPRRRRHGRRTTKRLRRRTSRKNRSLTTSPTFPSSPGRAQAVTASVFARANRKRQSPSRCLRGTLSAHLPVDAC